MKYHILHIADVHIRGLQYLDEIQYTFERLNEDIDKLFKQNVGDCFCLVVAGDIFHSKLTVTNEYFIAAIDIFKRLADKLPVFIIPGNHDLSLPNKDRMDAITPFVKALDGKTVWPIIFSKKSEMFPIELVKKDEKYDYAISGESDCHYYDNDGVVNHSGEIYFHHFSILDPKSKWPTEKNLLRGSFNIALYHGSINDSTVDSGWTSRGNQDNIEIFKGFDAALLGDIHQGQFLSPTIAYPGSVRQNNFGENLDKGYIHWTLEWVNGKYITKGEMKVLPQKRYFVTLFAGKESDIKIPEEKFVGSRIRVKLTKEIDIVEEIKIKNKIEELWKPCGDVEFVLPEILQRVDTRIEVDSDREILQENIRNLEVQKSLIDKFFENKELSEETFQELYELDKKYHTSIKTDLFRNVKWTIDEIQWDNLFSYGRDNKLDLKRMKGLIGINGPNGSGKSSVIDILALTLFNNITKEGSSKSFDYINRKSKNGWSKLKISMDGETYIIERGAKKTGKVEDEKVDNSIDFYKIDKDGKKKMLNGETKPDTNNAIRDIFGTLDDFSVTSLCSQFGLSKFIDARATERKKTISKFFDLDIFEQKYQLATERYKDIKSQLKLFDIAKYTKEIEENKLKLNQAKELLSTKEKAIEQAKKQLKEYNERLLELVKSTINIEQKSSADELINKRNKLENQFNQKNILFLELQKKNKLNSAEQVEAQKECLVLLRNKNVELKLAEQKLSTLSKAANLLTKIPNVAACKSCPLASDAFKASAEIDAYEAEVVGDLKLAVYSGDEKGILENIKNYESFNKLKIELDDVQNLLKNVDEEIEQYEKNKEIIENNKKIESSILELKSLRGSIQDYIDTMQSYCRTHEKEIAIAEANISNNNNRILEAKKLAHESYVYDLYLEAMGKDGIAFWIISKKIPLINNILNKILSNIWKMKINLENDEEEKTLKIICHDEGGARPAELASGAEKAVLSLALRTAFWYISSLPKSNLLILDEAFSYVENDRIESVMKALSYLKNFFSNIIIITHDDTLKGYVDHMVFVRKNLGYSKLEE